MNELGIALFWCTVQVTLLGCVAGICYLIGRKLRPSTGSLITLTSLMLVIALSILTFSPWPQWVPSLESADASIATTETSESAKPLTVDRTEASPDSEFTNPEESATGNVTPLAQLELEDEATFGSLLWTSITQGLKAEPVTTGTPEPWRWPALLGGVIVVGIGIGLVRLYLGWRAVHGYRNQSHSVSDVELLELVDTLCAELSYTHPVDVRQSSELVTAATIGWKRPLILLPTNWVDWSEQERRVVLAHEIAHISRNDFPAWICAQIGVMLHFYHPLVHWLANQLRLEQELAADAAAATLSGGRQRYLKTLAEMALRQADHRMGWPAQTFLPTRRTFLRRLEMLRHSKNLAAITLSRGARLGTIGLLLLAGFAAAGLRNPVGQLTQSAQAEQLPEKIVAQNTKVTGETESFDLSWVPADVGMVHAIRPSVILSRPEFQVVTKGLDEDVKLKEQLGFSVSKLDQAMMLLIVPRGARMNPAFIIRTSQPVDFSNLIKKSLRGKGENATYQGKTYYTMPTNTAGRGNDSCFVPNDRTFIFAESRDVLHTIIDAGEKGAVDADWSTTWKEVQSEQAAGIVNMEPLRGELNKAIQRASQGNPFAAMMPIHQQSKSITYGASLDKGLKFKIIADCADEKNAGTMKDTFEAAVTLGKNMIPGIRNQLENSPARGGEEGMYKILLGLGESILTSANVEQKNSTVIFTANGGGETASKIVEAWVPAVTSARAAARQTQAKNNLKQIALALHNYHAKHGHFPPASLTGPDNKTPHSWRVAILPYLNQEGLYKQYNPNQPWDSPNNKKVLDQMPPVFRDPGQNADSTSAAYFALINDESAFGKKEGTRIRDFRDGTSNTILIVESKREIPWTKPVDIPLNADLLKNFPKSKKLGGFYKSGFNAAFADGSVQFIPEQIDVTALRALFTIAGNEVVKRP